MEFLEKRKFLEKDGNTNCRKCFLCSKPINIKHYLTWEMMDFCNGTCLWKYQKCLGIYCTICKDSIQPELFGKYYLKLKQCFISFCSKHCYDSYRYPEIFCRYCERVKQHNNSDSWLLVKLDMTLKGSNNSVQICSKECYKQCTLIVGYNILDVPEGAECLVCKNKSPLKIIAHDKGQMNYICNEHCLTAFAYVTYNGPAEACHMCKHYFSQEILEKRTFFNEKGQIAFCSNGCLNLYRFMWKEENTCRTCSFQSINAINLYSVEKSTFCCLHCILSSPDVDEIWRTILEKDKKIIELSGKSSIITRSSTADKILQSVAKLSHVKISHRNISTMTAVSTSNKLTSVKPHVGHKKVQTITQKPSEILISIPVPIYVPTPMAMYSIATINPVPIPIPIPIPVFIPTTKNSAKDILKEINKVKNKLPEDPYQAELLEIANLLADNKNDSDADSASDDLKGESNITITNDPLKEDVEQKCDPPNKKKAKICDLLVKEELVHTDVDYNEDSCQPLDNVRGTRLAFTLGINAWKQWVTNRKFPKNMRVKTEILDMTPEELSYYLCLFVKELRKPNGDEYAPDTIYYLCLGIQYYLDTNNRTENIFVDQRFETFTDCLDKFARKFCSLYFDESRFIVTRVEEEHLWETKQLGCYSPHVLLNTLIYFNTKYFYRSTVDEHLELSFHHIVRVYKKKSGCVSTMLRFFPRSRNINDKRVYEQEEYLGNRIRCPIKIYEYYLSKCPESVKNESNSIYLAPEKYCLSESPLWYSTTPLPRESLEKIVNRVKMVKEVNVALLITNY